MLRNNMTEPEIILWHHLSKKQLEGLKFRRQHPILRYILDFYCHEIRLCIEIDGRSHSRIFEKIHDEDRTQNLAEFGITVLRFSNEAVLNDIDTVLERIRAVVSMLK